MGYSITSHLYMVRAHESEHHTSYKSIVENLARSCNYVWIVKGGELAKSAPAVIFARITESIFLDTLWQK